METLIIFLISLLSLGNVQKTDEQPVQENSTQYYFIRHAEKDLSDKHEKNPPLSEEGLERATKWTEVFKDVHFDHIFSTNYYRTTDTAKAIANSQEKQIETYDPGKLFDEEFQNKTKGKRVLIVGHSNTNPAFVNLIIGEKKYEQLDENEYGSLFIVTVAPNGENTSQVLYIN